MLQQINFKTGRLNEGKMTLTEKRLLEVHNASYEKLAISVTVYDIYRFYLDYSDGKRKHDYECGPTFSSLVRPIAIV